MASLNNIITFHVRKCTAEGCKGPCNHDNKTDDEASYDSDDFDLDDEDDLMEPASGLNEVEELGGLQPFTAEAHQI